MSGTGDFKKEWRSGDTILSQAQIIESLMQRILDLETMVDELASDLESEVNARYHGVKDHPVMKKKYDSDMEIVSRAREMIGDK